MNDDIIRQQAMILFERAFRHQRKGEYGDAIVLYKRSISIDPTAEAYTYLGWTYSLLNRYAEAIDYCKHAIAEDPEFGNPYQDIGAYLIELGQWDDAIPWLEQALKAPRYESPKLAHMNLGRIYQHQGQNREALLSYDRALSIDPFFRTAIWAKYQLLGELS